MLHFSPVKGQFTSGFALGFLESELRRGLPVAAAGRGGWGPRGGVKEISAKMHN